MQTHFTPAQLQDPAIALSEREIRRCVHCGFCTATCPTYVLLGDELDSPRGRIVLMKAMLETGGPPSAAAVRHVERCLSCLSCMTTCPSGVNYRQLVDHARAHIETHHRRPWNERLVRQLIAMTLPHPARLRPALWLARLARPLASLLAGSPRLAPLGRMLALAPGRLPDPAPLPPSAPAAPRGRVLLLQGCVEPVLTPEVRAATQRLLTRAGYAVELARGEGCCGALVHHLGREADGLDAARRNVDVWSREMARGDLAAIVASASGCGSQLRHYGEMLGDDPAYAARAAAVSALVRDPAELLADERLPWALPQPLTVAWHPPCSLQHGQKLGALAPRLLRAAGFEVQVPAESHLCCGAAGAYVILQGAIADRLGARKAEALDALAADVVATANIGCAVQIAGFSGKPVVHVVELLDWASGGPKPAGMA